MALDDLLSSSDDGPVGARAAARDQARDRRRAAVLGGVAVLVAVGLGSAVGLLAGQLDDGDDRRALPATPSVSPSATSSGVPRSASPSAVTPTPTATPTPSATPASGTDIGYLVGTRGTDEDGAAMVVSLDRVQFFTGEAARREATRRGQEIEVDYFVVNDNTRLRSLVVAAGATVTGDSSFNAWAGDPGRGPRPRTLEQLAGFGRTDQGRETLFDLRYDAAGRVTAIAERYLP